MASKISYEVVYLPDAETKGLDLPCDSPDYGFGLYLLTETPLCREHSYLVVADNGEPEDRVLYRDFEPVVKELNQLAEVRNDLLESCKALVGLAERRGKLHEYKAALDIARTAISKAEGEIQ